MEHSTYPAYFPVPLTRVAATGGTASLTRDAAGLYSLTLNAAGTAYSLGIPLAVLAHDIGPGTRGQGFRLARILLHYTVSGANASAAALAVYRETHVGNAARSATDVSGALSYTVDEAPAAGLPVTARANPYKVVVTLGSPLLLVAPFQALTAEFQLTTGATSGSAKLHAVGLLGNVIVHL